MLVLLFLITFTNVVRAYDALIDGVYYNLYQSSSIAVVTNEKDYVINGSDIYSGTIEIPETIQFNGKMYKVTEIGKYAFFGSKISSVSLPNSITTIGGSVFSYCSSLTSITIPNSVTTVGSAFSFCTSLSSVIIGNSVTSFVQEDGFRGCTALTTITSLAMTAPIIKNTTFTNIKENGTLYVPIGSTGYDVWMGTSNYYLGKYNWTKVEQ